MSNGELYFELEWKEKRLKAHMDRCSVCKAENEQLWGHA